MRGVRRSVKERKASLSYARITRMGKEVLEAEGTQSIKSIECPNQRTDD